MRFVPIALVLGLAAPAAAEQRISFPVSVPLECAQLAEREHVPLVENRVQAPKAKYKLARLNDAEPLVARCKQAVARVRAGTSG